MKRDQFKNIPYFIIGIFLTQNLMAQKPNIASINVQNGTVGTSVTIAGNGFSTNPSDLTVHFGAGYGKIINSTENLIEVLAPGTTTYDYISVTNKKSQLTGYSNPKFLLSFHGTQFDPQRLSVETNIAEDPGLFDLATADFDGDGLNDIATTNNSDAAATTSLTVYKNVTGTAEFDIKMQRFNDADLNTGTALRNITCGDLDGDGRPEIVVGKGGNTADRFFIFKNLSTPGIINFDKPITVLISVNSSSSTARRLKIHDLDNDGKPEIILTDQNLGLVHIFQNRSTANGISFPTDQKVTISSPSATFGIDVADLNKDGLPELVFGSNLQNDIYIAQNQSIPGKISFKIPVKLAVSGQLTNLQVGDFDGDGDNDILVNNYVNNVYLLINQSTGSSIIFSSPKYIETGRLPWGLDIGDINGDGKPDVVVATREKSQPLTLLLNQSNLTSIAFAPYTIGKAALHVNVNIADYNGDAKPDIAYVTDEQQIGFIRNQHCVVPEINPVNPPPICNDQPVTLRATPALKVDYNWQNLNTNISSINDFNFGVTVPGNYIVSLSSSADACEYNSNQVSVAVGGDILPAAPVISNPGVVCEGQSITLSSNSISGVTYYWKKPDGQTVSGNTITIASATSADAGRYGLVLQAPDGCRTEPAFTLVDVSSLPSMTISSTAGQYFCQGSQNILTTPFVDNATYTWQLNSNTITGQNSNQISITTSGSYSVSVKDTHGCTASSSLFVTRQVSKPVAKFEDLSSTCLNQPIQFTNSSQYDNTIDVFFNWDFGDNGFSNVKDPTHTYSSSGNYNVSLTVNYEDKSCADTYQYPVSVAESLALNILVNDHAIDSDIYENCAGDTVKLSVDAQPGQVTWSTGSTQPQIMVNKADTYTVVSGEGTGCASQDQVEIQEVPNVHVQVVSGDQRINRGGTAQLGAEGAQYYSWDPITALDNPNISNPQASPTKTTTYTVTGTNEYGCSGQDQVTVFLEGSSGIAVDAMTVFTPNSDGRNDQWEIKNIDVFKACPIRIMNRRGQTVYESSEYHNDWDGTMNGNEVPEGAYYFILSCTNNEVHTGSFTLVR